MVVDNHYTRYVTRRESESLSSPAPYNIIFSNYYLTLSVEVLVGLWSLGLQLVAAARVTREFLSSLQNKCSAYHAFERWNWIIWISRQLGTYLKKNSYSQVKYVEKKN